MLQSKLLIPTLRQAPNDAEVISHQLMVRAGFIRKLASGVYTYLPLAYRVLKKIESIVEEEMMRAGAQQVLLPIVMPAELWIETGRWGYYGKELLRFKDRHDRDFCIGPTHEEAMTDLVRNNVSSYRQLPMNLFQIQTKFRDEVRPRYGLMRGREFIMKDGYSFHTDEASCHEEYENMFHAYGRVFERCGLKFRAVEAMTGNIGGSKSHEFQVLAQSGEDTILSCSECSYAANIEKAPLKRFSAEPDQNNKGKFEKVLTPDQKSIQEVSQFLGLAKKDCVKALAYKADDKMVLVLVRGDRELMEAKLSAVLGVSSLELATEEEIQSELNSIQGFIGPIGINCPVYADFELAGLKDFVLGANEKDFHFKNVNPADFKVEAYFDLRQAMKKDLCPRCEKGKYEEHKGIEVGQVFFLGEKYSRAMNATFTNEAGEEQVMVMGTYGIGVSRTAAASIEQNHDDQGIIWPYAIAPFHFHIVSLDPGNEEVHSVALKLYQELQSAGVEVLLDDREGSPGMKFKDSDLIGIPYRIVIGGRGLKNGIVELKSRADGKQQELAPNVILETCLKIHKEHSDKI